MYQGVRFWEWERVVPRLVVSSKEGAKDAPHIDNRTKTPRENRAGNDRSGMASEGLAVKLVSRRSEPNAQRGEDGLFEQVSAKNYTSFTDTPGIDGEGRNGIGGQRWAEED